jgi:hypothetical protein
MFLIAGNRLFNIRLVRSSETLNLILSRGKCVCEQILRERGCHEGFSRFINVWESFKETFYKNQSVRGQQKLGIFLLPLGQSYLSWKEMFILCDLDAVWIKKKQSSSKQKAEIHIKNDTLNYFTYSKFCVAHFHV